MSAIGERAGKRVRTGAASTEPTFTPAGQRRGVNAVEEWQAALDDAGELSGAVVERILAVHGDRGARAIEAVSEDRVKQYRDFTVVVGHTDEYVVEDGGCTCADSEYNLDPEDPTDVCWHTLAVEIAARIDAVEHHDMWYSEVREFL
jgi:predicted nucleic acid-binding Zn finger protein